LNDDELDVLRQAGIFKGKQPASKGRRNHIVFVSDEKEVNNYIGSSSSNALQDIDMSEEDVEEVDLGWRLVKASKSTSGTTDEHKQEERSRRAELREEAKTHRSRLLKELAARLARDTQLRYAERELEMQRLLMGKGGSRKIRGVEKVEGDDEEEEDEDERDAQKGSSSSAPMDEKSYKPRVYRWRAERKR